MTLRDLSFFYQNLVVTQEAGIDLIQFFESMIMTSPGYLQKRKIRYLVERLKAGANLVTAFKASSLIPINDLPILEAGEKTGKLVLVFKLLQKNYQYAAEAESRVKYGLIMPGLFIILAVFIPSIPALINETITLRYYLVKNLLILALVFGSARWIYYLFMKSYYDERLAQKRRELSGRVVLLKRITTTIALEKFCKALEISLDVGMLMTDALKIAGDSSGDHEVKMASRRIIAEVKSGRDLVQPFEMESIFTHEIKNAIRSGDKTGTIPYFLSNISDNMRSDVQIAIVSVSSAIPVIVYWVAAACAVVTVLL